ncbi:MAG: ribonuclease Z, partial [Candidatus Omnitrophica bacterium]|nr:ribonuclease Z [Candidatus Omnitrophota bacterium]
MKIVFLGTNGWYDTETGNTVSILIETKHEFIILDAGGGFHKIGRYIKGNKPISLFLSHLHLDHIIGLHTLARFNFPQGISLYCPAGTKKSLTRIINRPYTVPFKRLKTKISLHQLNPAKLPMPLKEIKRLKHPVACYGFRFVLENKIVSYCPDTGLCSNLFKLAKGADMFITECSAKPGKKDKKWP